MRRAKQTYRSRRERDRARQERVTADRVLGSWFHAAREGLDWSYGQWYTDAAADLVEAVVNGEDVDEPAVRLGAVRARQGAAWDDTLCDAAILFDALEAAELTLPPDTDGAEFVAALAVGHTASLEGSTAGSGVGAVDELSLAVRALYRAPDAKPRDTHMVVVLDLDLTHCSGEHHGQAVHVAARSLREHLPGAEATAGVGRARFAAVVRRHPGLAVALRLLADGLTTNQQLHGAEPSVRLRSLPAHAPGVGQLVRSLIAPTPAWGGGHHISADPLVARELQDVLSPPAPPQARGREALRPLRAPAWVGASPTLAVAVAAAVLALGLAAAGPTGDRTGEEGSIAFGAQSGPPPTTVQPVTLPGLVGLDGGIGGLTPVPDPDPDPESGSEPTSPAVAPSQSGSAPRDSGPEPPAAGAPPAPAPQEGTGDGEESSTPPPGDDTPPAPEVSAADDDAGDEEEAQRWSPGQAGDRWNGSEPRREGWDDESDAGNGRGSSRDSAGTGQGRGPSK